MADDQLRELLTELKLNSERMSAKLEQTYNSIEKLEASITKMEALVSTQERRLIILEQCVPDNLTSDLALMKDSLETYKRFSWIVAGAVVASWINQLLDLMHK